VLAMRALTVISSPISTSVGEIVSELRVKAAGTSGTTSSLTANDPVRPLTFTE